MPITPIFLLFASLLLTGLLAALNSLGRERGHDLLQSEDPPLLFLRPALRLFFSHDDWDRLREAVALGLLLNWIGFEIALALTHSLPFWIYLSGAIAIPLVVDTLLTALASRFPRALLRLTAPLASLLLLPLSPLLALCLAPRKSSPEPSPADGLDLHDAKLLSSFVGFKDRVAKEIMVPRVDLFSLPAETSIREAARLFASEGYSRIPIFRETLDEVVGVVLYKDLLKILVDNVGDLDAPIETLAKPVLYAPENKRIAHLLQEFRAKQIHMAIIVDEYGGTEGVVTIEDILEELVGEIEDEYDIEGPPFFALPSGGWVVDAKMSILDIEDQIGIQIPQSPEYETIGGYIFHQAGTIPPKGWRLSHDVFDLEVLSSNERSIKKIKITPHRLENPPILRA